MVLYALRRNKKYLDKEMKVMKVKVLSLLKEDQHAQLILLTSIPRIGKKPALFLMVVSNGFFSLYLSQFV